MDRHSLTTRAAARKIRPPISSRHRAAVLVLGILASLWRELWDSGISFTRVPKAAFAGDFSTPTSLGMAGRVTTTRQLGYPRRLSRMGFVPHSATIFHSADFVAAPVSFGAKGQFPLGAALFNLCIRNTNK